MADPRTWHAHIKRDLDLIQVGLLDLVDCGLPHDDTDVHLRRPTDDEVKATRRGQDADADYATPGGRPGRWTTIADPVAAEAIRWVAAVADGIADVDALLGAWISDADRAARRGGTRLPPSPAPLDLVTDQDEPEARPTIHPARARRAVIARHRWLAAAAGALADHWEFEVDPDLIAFWNDRAAVLQHATRAAARRHGRRTERDTRCANPHGLTNHPAGDRPVGGVCVRCRNAPRCDDRYGYGCTRPMVREGPRTRTCNSCQQRAYRERLEIVSERTG